MANNFKVTALTLNSTSETILLTAGADSVLIISSIIIANTHASTDSTISLVFTDTSQSADFNILTTEPVNHTISREILSRPMILESTDVLKIQAANPNIYDIMVSYLDRGRS